MVTNLEPSLGASSAVRLGRYTFELVGSLVPRRDTSGIIMELSPQKRYADRDQVPLHKHGHGTFCNFRISVPNGVSGVYALVVDGSVRYVGECKDLRKRFNSGYGNISPKNCYLGGQPTNCKINRRVLEVTKAGKRVDLYFHSTLQRKAVEKELLDEHLPPWNG